MNPIEKVFEVAIDESRKELFKFIYENYGTNDPSLTVESLSSMFSVKEIQITNDKFEENRGRGRPRKSSTQA
jgi:hypothetical protein